MTPDEIEETRERYYQAFRPLFFPELPFRHDVISYLASILRIVGMEDGGWDPFVESRATLENINHIMQMDLPEDRFPDAELTRWRMGLLMYSHMVEMDAPYEVITNLLRFHLGYGYSPNPYFKFLTADEQKNFARRGIYPSGKIKIIKQLSDELGSPVGAIFDEFYRSKLRNAISHSDYIFTDTEFRVRSGTGAWAAYSIPLAQLGETITRTKVFYSTFFGIERAARKGWADVAGRVLPYDLPLKGLLEFLTEGGLLSGFRVHWPNGSDSVYRRTDDGIEMSNCHVTLDDKGVALMIGRKAQRRSLFSPLVEFGEAPRYTNRENGQQLSWPGDGSV